MAASETFKFQPIQMYASKKFRLGYNILQLAGLAKNKQLLFEKDSEIHIRGLAIAAANICDGKICNKALDLGCFPLHIFLNCFSQENFRTIISTLITQQIIT